MQVHIFSLRLRLLKFIVYPCLPHLQIMFVFFEETVTFLFLIQCDNFDLTYLITLVGPGSRLYITLNINKPTSVAVGA